MRRHVWRGLVVGPVAVLIALSAWPGAAATTDEHVVFRIQPAEIDESSSLVVSTTHPHLAYTTNDSGDSATVYVLDSRTGALVGSTDLTGVDAIDVEGLAGGSDGSLVMADIGDNDGVRPEVSAYRFQQPGRSASSVVPDAVTLTYDGGPRDAEGVLYDAGSGRIYVVSKEYAEAHVYRSPRHVFDRNHAVLRPVAHAPDLATDATFVPDGGVVAIRTYLAVDFYRFRGWTPLATMPLPLQRQGESIAAPAGGKELWIGSEGVHSAVLAVSIPDLERSSPPTTSAAPQPAASEGDEHRELLKNRAVVIGGSATALLAVVVVIGIVRYIRHHPDH
jgi:hypothetical protein